MRKHAVFVDAIIADLREAASGYTENFQEETGKFIMLIHAKATANLNEYEEQGYKCLLYREEPFMYAKIQ
ncbi:MAG: hypothetical protein ACLS9K_05005 [Lachnospira eligens]